MFEVTTTGKTGWAPGTRKFILYDWKTGNKPMGIAIGASATTVRTSPAVTGGKMAYAEIRQWQARGAPLRCVAIVVVTKKGWHWRPYNGHKTWAAKSYWAV